MSNQRSRHAPQQRPRSQQQAPSTFEVLEADEHRPSSSLPRLGDGSSEAKMELNEPIDDGYAVQEAWPEHINEPQTNSGDSVVFGGISATADQLRYELNQYLEDVLSKKDEDGNSLVEFPSNFDEVVDAMSRDDIASDNPWYACLLEQPPARGGRMSNEEAIARGMAQIRLLDGKLQSLDQRNPVGTQNEPPTSHRTNYVSSPSAGSTLSFTLSASTAHTQSTQRKASKQSRRTFLTAHKAASQDDSTTETESTYSRDVDTMSNEIASARSHQAFRKREKDTVSRPHRVAVEEREKAVGRNIDPATNYLMKNREYIGASLTPEEDAWVQRLLADDEEANADVEENPGIGVWASLAQYGFSDSEEARVKEIDEELKALRGPMETVDVADEKVAGHANVEDYLRQQIRVKAEKEREKNITTTLKQIHAQNSTDEVWSLIDDSHIGDGLTELTQRPSLLELPEVAAIQEWRQVSFAELDHLGDEARASGLDCAEPQVLGELLESIQHQVQALAERRALLAQERRNNPPQPTPQPDVLPPSATKRKGKKTKQTKPKTSKAPEQQVASTPTLLAELEEVFQQQEIDAADARQKVVASEDTQAIAHTESLTVQKPPMTEVDIIVADFEAMRRRLTRVLDRATQSVNDAETITKETQEMIAQLVRSGSTPAARPTAQPNIQAGAIS